MGSGTETEMRALGLRAMLLGALSFATVMVVVALGLAPPSVAANQCVVNAAPDSGVTAHRGDAQCCPPDQAVGTVTASYGPDAPPVGWKVCDDGVLSAGAGSGFQVTTSDGSVWTFGPNSYGVFVAPANCTVAPGANGASKVTCVRTSGNIQVHSGSYSATKAAHDASSASLALEVITSRGVVGVEAGQSSSASFTVTAPKQGAETFHVVSGTGFASEPHKPTLHVPAGYGARLTAGGLGLTTDWPASARALVPPNQRPPAITALRLVAAATPQVTFRLNRAARVVVQVLRDKRLMQKRTAGARKGANRVMLRALSRGRYLIVVTAVDSAGRTAVAQKSVTVR